MRRSVDSVDRAMRDLETAGLVRVERRRRGRENLTNRYHLRTTNPADRRPAAAGAERAAEADRTHDATDGGGRRSAALPKATDRSDEVLTRCGITDLAALAERCQTARQALGLSSTRWAAPCLLAAIQLAVLRGWPPQQIQPALLALAADRETRSPMRVAEAGPWWDQPPPPPTELDGVDLAALEAELDDIPEQRPALQAKARDELATEHLPVTRATVAARAVQILHRSRQEVA